MCCTSIETTNTTSSARRNKKKRTKESIWRHALKSDENVKFLYDKSTLVIHDKGCSLLQNIPDENIGCLYSYQSTYSQCPHCLMSAYLKIGAKDPEDLKEYVTLYQRMKVDTNLLREIYIEKQCHTFVTNKIITVINGEEKWQIKSLNDEGIVQLKHNNYLWSEQKGRRFIPGFHVQNNDSKGIAATKAFRLLLNYSFQPHGKSQDVISRGDSSAIESIAT